MSLNCRGLGSLEKRRDVLNYIKQKQFSIYFLQDTHFTENDYEQIRAFWGYNIYISPGRSDARGTAILLNNNFEHHVKMNSKMKMAVINVCNKYDILLVYMVQIRIVQTFSNLFLILFQITMVNLLLLLVTLILFRTHSLTITIIIMLTIKKQEPLF